MHTCTWSHSSRLVCYSITSLGVISCRRHSQAFAPRRPSQYPYVWEVGGTLSTGKPSTYRMYRVHAPSAKHAHIYCVFRMHNMHLLLYTCNIYILYQIIVCAVCSIVWPFKDNWKLLESHWVQSVGKLNIIRWQFKDARTHEVAICIRNGLTRTHYLITNELMIFQTWKLMVN